ncbi:hypothetical protein EDB81DRAFT_874733 [Dactylonectria macrodidyma]|uniref:DUF7924 domain-containing protein n=1 Tax=Dactylonectria macrodidyma TaxID=307937 RepID=A0A9P9FSL8_9HYPO|nr:hypothetical protein EDB81DRAFT_874733 [Dactylonectria macrodidyma]
MNSGLSKAWTRRSRVQLSTALQETLLDAVAGNNAGAHVDIPRNLRDSWTHQVKIFRGTTPGVEDEEAEQARKLVQTALQQPKPNRPQRSCASFLKDFVDPVHPDPHLESVHTFVSEWLQSVGSDREKHCRSDKHLHRSNDDPVLRKITRSAPEMGCIRDADGFAVPLTPASSRTRRSCQPTEDSASSTASVRHPSYRENNLTLNNIDVRNSRARLPDHISIHTEGLRVERDSPGLSSEQIDEYLDSLDTLASGCNEAEVEEFFEDTVFPKGYDATYGRQAGLGKAKSSPMSSSLVPNNPTCQFWVSQPKPDLLFGYYNALRDGAFTQSQFLTQGVLHPQNARCAEATTKGLRFPFFAIEIKAAGGTRGDLWVATNQLAGSSSACLNAVDRLNTSSSEASEPEDFKNFRKQVRNILDWGKGTRLLQIKDALDRILEDNRKKATEQAKSRQPPSNGCRNSRSNKYTSSSSQPPGRDTDEPDWESYVAASHDVHTKLSSAYPEVDQQD